MTDMTAEERARKIYVGPNDYEATVIIGRVAAAIRAAERAAYERAAVVADASNPERSTQFLHSRLNIAAAIRKLGG